MKYGILREHCKKQKEDRIKQLCRGKLPRIYRRRLPDRLNYAKRKGSLKKYWKTAFKTYGSHSRHVQPDLSGNLVSERNRNTFKSQLLSGHRRSCGRGFTILAVIFWERREKETGGYRETDKNTRDEEDPWRILYEDEEGQRKK